MKQLNLDENDEAVSSAAALVDGILTGFLIDPTTRPGIEQICAHLGRAPEHVDAIMAALRTAQVYFSEVGGTMGMTIESSETMQ